MYIFVYLQKYATAFRAQLPFSGYIVFVEKNSLHEYLEEKSEIAHYGVASTSRLLKKIGLFCKRAIYKKKIFCKRDV